MFYRARLSIARDVAAGMRSLYAHGMQHRHLTSKAILLTHGLQAKVHHSNVFKRVQLLYRGFARQTQDI